MTVPDLMVKARRALESARLLLASDDCDGACNRAYYAMFDAARAALWWDDPSCAAVDVIKTHSGLIAAFSLRLVRTGKVSVELGKALNKVEDLRLIADYRDQMLDGEHAAWAVGQADQFVEAVARLVGSEH